LRPLKFLGFVYDPETDTLRSECRSGTSLTLSEDVKALVMASHAEARIRMTGLPKSVTAKIGRSIDSSDSSDLAGYLASMLGTATKHLFTWDMLAASSYLGFICSRMTLGKWNPTDVLQNFSLTLKSEKSFVDWYRNLGGMLYRKEKLKIDLEIEQ